MKSYAEQLAFLDRLSGLLKKRHAKARKENSMTKASCDEETACLEAVRFTVDKVKTLAEISEEMKPKSSAELESCPRCGNVSILAACGACGKRFCIECSPWAKHECVVAMNPTR
jgi:hypothetical protein